MNIDQNRVLNLIKSGKLDEAKVLLKNIINDDLALEEKGARKLDLLMSYLRVMSQIESNKDDAMKEVGILIDRIDADDREMGDYVKIVKAKGEIDKL